MNQVSTQDDERRGGYDKGRESVEDDLGRELSHGQLDYSPPATAGTGSFLGAGGLG